VFTNVLLIALGILFMLLAFLTPGIRGAFSKGPLLPITTVGRVGFFLIGLLVFVEGIKAILR